MIILYNIMLYDMIYFTTMHFSVIVTIRIIAFCHCIISQVYHCMIYVHHIIA